MINRNYVNVLWRFLICLLTSFVGLLLFSQSSPLYPGNPGVDTNVYLTIARGLRTGLIPYRDLMDHKGPLFYLFYWLAALISSHSYIGVFVVETIAMTTFMRFCWKTAELFSKPRICLLIVSGLLCVSTYAFYHGGSCEELSLPFMAYSLYILIKFLKSNNPKMPAVMLFVNGIMAGCVFSIKYSLLGLHFAWMGCIAIISIIREHKIGNAVRMCLIFLGGMCVAILPYIIWFSSQGSLDALISVYITNNLGGYASTEGGLLGIIKNIFVGTVVAAYRNSIIFIVVAIGFVWILLRKQESWSLKITLLAMLISMITFIYCSGRRYAYYSYAICAFVPIFCAAGSDIYRKMRQCSNKKAILVGSVSVIACLVISFATNLNIRKIGFPSSKTVARVFADYIDETEDVSVLNYFTADNGTYLAAGVIPECKWFSRLGMADDECIEVQTKAIKEKEIDYLITDRDISLIEGSPENYELVMTQKEEYNWEYSDRVYYLYERKGQ